MISPRHPSPRTGSAQGWTAVEAAAAFAVVGGALAVLIPSCMRSIRWARTAEATDNLQQLTNAVVRTRSDAPKAPLSAAPLTPPTVPRGGAVRDPDGTWDHATWKQLEFSVTEPHWYAYRLDVDSVAVETPAREGQAAQVAPGDNPQLRETGVRLTAHGDIDGDGVLSTFVRRVDYTGGSATPRPGLEVTSDLE